MIRPRLMTLATAALCLVATPLAAQDTASATKTSDPSGTYHWIQDYGQGETDHWLILKADGDKLTGSYMQGDYLTVPIEDGEIEDGKFEFELELEVDGTEVEVEVTGHVEGDKLVGVTEIDADGEVQEIDLEAQRKTRPEDVVGTWNLVIEAEGQVFEPTAVVTLDGDELKIKYLTDEFGDHDAIDVKLADNKLQGKVAVEAPEGGITLTFITMPRGDKMTGEVEYELGDIVGSAEVEGEREAPAADPVGTWNVVIEAEGQIFEPTMVVTRDGDDFKVEYLTDEFGDHEAIDVKLDGDKLTFTIAVEAPEGALKLDFDTKLDGDELTGEVEYQVGDIVGSAEVEGEREPGGDPVGTWEMTIEAEGQIFEPTMKVTRDGDQLKVEYLTDEFGDHEAIDVKLDGNHLTFTIAVESPEGALKLNFDTKIEGDEVAGEVEYEVGDIVGSAEVEGERADD